VYRVRVPYYIFQWINIDKEEFSIAKHGAFDFCYVNQKPQPMQFLFIWKVVQRLWLSAKKSAAVVSDVN
jgi:hypothetical protein